MHKAPNAEPMTIPISRPAVKLFLLRTWSGADDLPPDPCEGFRVLLWLLCSLPGGGGMYGGGGGAGPWEKELPPILCMKLHA